MAAVTDIQAPAAQGPSPSRVKLDEPPHIGAVIAYLAVIVAGLLFMAWNIYHDISAAGGAPKTIGPFLLLGLALLIALGFEFVNGFHDTATAVATVIYTHSLPAQAAVIWSGRARDPSTICTHHSLVISRVAPESSTGRRTRSSSASLMSPAASRAAIFVASAVTTSVLSGAVSIRPVIEA